VHLKLAKDKQDITRLEFLFYQELENTATLPEHLKLTKDKQDTTRLEFLFSHPVGKHRHPA